MLYFSDPFVEGALEFLDGRVHPIVVDQEVSRWSGGSARPCPSWSVNTER